MQTSRFYGVPAWTLPIFTGTVWLITLLALLVQWALDGSTHYPEMLPHQHIAYVSNVGASRWGRPIFITGSAITVASFSVSLAAERWLRHKSELISASSRWMTFFSVMIAWCMTLGSCSLIFLTIFDVRDQPLIHYPLVSIFICGYIFTATFMCAEKGFLSRCYPTNKSLRHSFRIKLFFLFNFVGLSASFTATMYQRIYAPSVILEWLLGLLLALYMWSCAIDFFAVPQSVSVDLADDWSDIRALLAKGCNEENGISVPKKARSNNLHRHYIELP